MGGNKQTKQPKTKARIDFPRNKKFSDSEYEIITEIYTKIVTAGGTDIMTAAQFCEFFSIFLRFEELKILNRVLLVFDAEAQSIVRPEVWMELFSIFLHGSLNKKMRLCFSVYDSNRNGRLTRAVLRKFIAKFACGPREDHEELIYGTVDTLAFKLDIDRDGIVSFDDYRLAVEQSPCLLECLGQIFPDMSLLTELMEA